MIYAYRCTECQLLRCTEDGKVCAECLTNMSNTIEADPPAKQEGDGLSRFLQNAFEEYFKQIKQQQQQPKQPPERAPPDKSWDPGFFRTNYLNFYGFLDGEVIPRIQQKHNVIVTKYNIGHDTFHIDVDLVDPLPATESAFIRIQAMEKEIVADLNQALRDWTQNGRELPWPY